MINLIQIIALVVGLFAVSRAYLRMREHKISIQAFLFWTAIWVAVIVVAFHPAVATQVSQYFGVERGIDVFVYISILLLFYLIFRIYVKIESIERNLTRTVREVAIKRAKKK